MKNILKTIVSLILVVALLLTATSCAVNGVADAIRESNTGKTGDINYSHTGDSTETASEKETFLQNSTLDKEELSPPTDENGSFVSEEFLTEAEMAEFLLCIEEFKKQDIFSFATDCVAYDIYGAGYDVFCALAIVGEEMVPGLAFTNYETYETTEERTIYNCGFVQLTEMGVDADVAITRENVDQGVVVVPYGEYDTTTGFIVSMGISLPSYSGIYNDYYFRYDQISDYTVSISVQENDRSVWDENIDLFNFTENKFVFKGDMSYNGTSASPYFSDEAKAYAAAREAFNKIIEYQESNAYKVEKQVIIVYTQDVIEEYLLNNGQGTINGFLTEKINDIEVGENQFVVVTTEGVSIQTVIDEEALAKERHVNGVVNFLGSLALTAGAIFVTVASCGAAVPLAVSAICVVAGTGATLYGISNMIEAGQNVYYGAVGDIHSEAVNPVLECFKAAIPDDELATKIFHIWGISSALLPSVILPANAAISMSNAAKAAGATVSVWQTGVAVVRAVGVEVVKMAVTGLVATGVGYGTNVIVTDLTGNENWGKVAGFGTALFAGAFVYNGLNRLDAKYNFSGLYAKSQIVNTRQKEVVDDDAANRYSTENGRSKKYDGWTRDDYLNNIDDPELKSVADQIYRENAKYGDGGTADAVRYTKQTGELIGNSDHVVKAQGRVLQLQKIIKRGRTVEPFMSYHDMEIAHSLISDLIHSINYIP